MRIDKKKARELERRNFNRKQEDKKMTRTELVNTKKEQEQKEN